MLCVGTKMFLIDDGPGAADLNKSGTGIYLIEDDDVSLADVHCKSIRSAYGEASNLFVTAVTVDTQNPCSL